LTDFRPKWNLGKGIEESLEAYKKYNLAPEDLNSEKYFRVRMIRSLMKEGKVDDDLMITGGKK